MGLNQNRNRESEVCDNIVNQAANEAVNLWRARLLSGGARVEERTPPRGAAAPPSTYHGAPSTYYLAPIT